MWNSVQLLDGVKWSTFDRSSPPLMDDNNESIIREEETTSTAQFRSWDFKSHQQTNYADWSNRHEDGPEDDAEDLFAVGGRRGNNYPSAAELFRNFVGELFIKPVCLFVCFFLSLLLQRAFSFSFFLLYQQMVFPPMTQR